MDHDDRFDAPLDIDLKAGSRAGCILVLIPLTAFFFVMPDALHVWSPPWTQPFLWLVGGIGSWLVLRWFIDNPLRSLGLIWRAVVCCVLAVVALALAVQILRSV